MSKGKRGTPDEAIRRCRDVIELLGEFIEGGLPADDARRLEMHLAGCSACVEFLESLKKTRDAVGRLRAEEIPPDCQDRLRSFLRERIKRRRP